MYLIPRRIDREFGCDLLIFSLLLVLSSSLLVHSAPHLWDAIITVFYTPIKLAMLLAKLGVPIAPAWITALVLTFCALVCGCLLSVVQILGGVFTGLFHPAMAFAFLTPGLQLALSIIVEIIGIRGAIYWEFWYTPWRMYDRKEWRQALNRDLKSGLLGK